MGDSVRRYGDGVLVYEPVYSWITRTADLIGTYLDFPVSIGLPLASEMAWDEVVGGVGVSISIVGVARLLLMKLSGRLYRGVRQHVGPMEMEIAMFPDAPTETEDGMIGQVISAETV